MRYNKIVIATDADVDECLYGCFCSHSPAVFPSLIRQGIANFADSLYRVENKKETLYCYNTEERDKALRS